MRWEVTVNRRGVQVRRLPDLLPFPEPGVWMPIRVDRAAELARLRMALEAILALQGHEGGGIDSYRRLLETVNRIASAGLGGAPDA